MKKISAILAALLIATSLISCGGSDPGNTSGPSVGSSADNRPTNTSKESPAQTTGNPPAQTTDSGSDDPLTPPAKTEFKVGTAEELAAAILAINDTDAEEDSVITLTADIDLTGYTDCEKWEPLYRFSGTFDGAGHTLKNLNWNFTMSNDGNTNMPVATDDYSYVLENLNNSIGGNCAAYATVSLLILELDGGTVKDLTLADSSLTIHCSYNKNYLIHLGALIGYVNSGTVSNVGLVNVDMTVPDQVNTNHAFVGYAAPLIGRVTGTSAVSGCTADAACLVDASANVKMNTAKLIGILDDESGLLTVENCSSEAETKVHPSPTADGLMYQGADTELGGQASNELVGKDLTK